MTRTQSVVAFAGAVLTLAGLIYGGFRLMVFIGEVMPTIVKSLS